MKVQGTGTATPTQFRKSSAGPKAKNDFQKTLESADKPQQSAEETPSRQQIESAVDQLNKTMRNYNTELRFKMDEESREMQVSVINSRTDEVIRKIPPDKILNIVAHVKEMLGIIVDEMI